MVKVFIVYFAREVGGSRETKKHLKKIQISSGADTNGKIK